VLIEAAHHAVKTASILSEFHPDLRRVAVEAERQAEHTVKTLGRALAESELGGLAQAEGTGRDDRESSHARMMPGTTDSGLRPAVLAVAVLAVLQNDPSVT
jgi:hypothetical protein